MLWTDRATKILKKYWNIDKLKDKQYEVINNLLLKKDVIGLLPTGYGKSMCYLLPPLVSKKVMFIISPLISLMEDQKEKLDTMEIPCAALHCNNKNKQEEIFHIIDGNIKIVYMSPEFLIKGEGLDLVNILIEKNLLGYLAVDEAHCISSWGHDFRPEYSQIKLFRDKYPEIPILAITATATMEVCNDIISVLKLRNPVTVRASFDRPNLFLKICQIPTVIKTVMKGNKLKQVECSMDKELLIKEYIDKYKNEKIIIYTNSRDNTVELSLAINKIYPDISQAYHAGLNKKKREEIQNNFIDGTIKIIICTIAFGMGIDQIVRCVIIFGCPSSVEEYFQQIGRGGRDGKDCETVLYFDYKNLAISKWMLKDIKLKYPNIYNCKLNNLNKISKLVYLDTCRRRFILEHFNERCNFTNCNKCDNCCNQEWTDITQDIQNLTEKELKQKYILDLSQYVFDYKNNKKLIIKIPNKFISKPDDDSFENKISKFEKFI